MKKLFFFSTLLLWVIVASAQVPVDSITKKITYQEVVSMEGTKDTLYVRGLMWINAYFKNPQGVTQLRDPENGVLMGAHRIAMKDTDKDGNVLPSNVTVDFKFKIEAKEGRYRYTIDDFNMKATSKFPLERWLNKADPQYTPKWDEYLVQVDTHIREMIVSLKKGMEPKKVRVDEW